MGVLVLVTAGSAAEAKGTFGSIHFAAQGDGNASVSGALRFPAGTRQVVASFAYSGLGAKAHWVWRLTRDGEVVDESYERVWRSGRAGTLTLPLTLPGGDGIFDLDLYLDDTIARIGSFVVGAPAMPDDRVLERAETFSTGPDRVKTSGKPYADAIVEVEATATDAKEAGAFGIVFRYEDDANFHAFVINSRGQHAVVASIQGKVIWKEPWTAEARGVIRTGAASNRLRVLSDRFRFRFYVNEVYAGALDNLFTPQGQVGVVVLGRPAPGTQVAFEHWRVSALAPRYSAGTEHAPWVRFAFATPGKTRIRECLERLGEPYLDYETATDAIAVLGAPSQLPLGVYDRAVGTAVPNDFASVRVLTWAGLDSGAPVATFVFRADTLWYASFPAAPTEATAVELTSRHGPAQLVTLERREVDVIHQVKVFGYPQRGMAFTQVDGEPIANRIVFEAAAELPKGLR